MSLESQISALVSAANKLTSEVANKMKGVDNAVTAAQEKFDEFTGKDFPARVSDARIIAVYIDPENGDDNNTGLGSGAPFKTWGAVSGITGGSAPIYDRVVVRVRAGTTLVMNNAVYSKDSIEITPYGSVPPTSPPTRLVQGFYSGGASEGRPMIPFRCNYVFINQNGDAGLEVHTAEFKEGHRWVQADEENRESEWLCYAGAMIQNVPRVKLRNVRLCLHDMPLTTIYMGGSLGDYAQYQVVLGAGCEIIGEQSGAGSSRYTHRPKLVHVYNNSRVPLDLIASTLTLGGSISSMSDLFENLSLENVRSSFTI
ncbi:hypothetical protein LZG37_00725 [Halomonas titanicae]|uniref:hypothetical protein n=1 Tax=Vreelandella titanicae TaxID=664683 RepID=UPI001F2E766A|nr:hypothetical protein [Halomonas titanicae]MCE7516642.1 hypothetical protein [Halomonas titanicae]